MREIIFAARKAFYDSVEEFCSEKEISKHKKEKAQTESVVEELSAALKDEPTSVGRESTAFRAINVAVHERIDIIALDRRSSLGEGGIYRSTGAIRSDVYSMDRF